MSTVSIFVFLFVLVAYSCQEAISDEAAHKARTDCQKEAGIAEELIEKAEKGEFSDDGKFKCFTKCFYVRLGYVNDAGEPQLEAIKENIPEALREKGNKALEKCKDTKGDPCEKSFELHKCYFEQMQAEL